MKALKRRHKCNERPSCTQAPSLKYRKETNFDVYLRRHLAWSVARMHRVWERLRPVPSHRGSDRRPREFYGSQSINAAYARGRAASLSPRCHSRGLTRKHHAGPVPITSISLQSPSICSNHELCGRPLARLRTGLTLAETPV